MTARLGDPSPRWANGTPSSEATCTPPPSRSTRFLEQRASAGPASRATAAAIRAAAEKRRNMGQNDSSPCASGNGPLTLCVEMNRTKVEHFYPHPAEKNRGGDVRHFPKGLCFPCCQPGRAC